MTYGPPIIRVFYDAFGAATTRNVVISVPFDCVVGVVQWSAVLASVTANDALRLSLVTSVDASLTGTDRVGLISTFWMMNVAGQATSFTNFNYSVPFIGVRINKFNSLYVYSAETGTASFQYFCMVALHPILR